MISADPASVSSRVAWLTAVVLLAAALTGAILIAVHYRGETAALRRQLHFARAPVPRSAAADRIWAAGTTDARGSADLKGQPWTVLVSHEYYLALGAPGMFQDHPGPAVHGHFGIDRGLSAVPGGIAPCAPLIGDVGRYG